MMEIYEDEANVSIEEAGESILWHQQHRNTSVKGLKMLAPKGNIPYLNNMVVDFYEPRVLGKAEECCFGNDGSTT